MTTIFPIYVACKNCGQQIPTVTIGSTNTCGELHTDLYQENGGAQVIDYREPLKIHIFRREKPDS
jgi:hypothetical protein